MKPEDTVRYLEYIKKQGELREKREDHKKVPVIVYVVATILISVFAFLTWMAWNMEWEWGVVIFGSGLVGTAVGSMSAISRLASDGETEWVPDDDEWRIDDDKDDLNPGNPSSYYYREIL